MNRSPRTMLTTALGAALVGVLALSACSERSEASAPTASAARPVAHGDTTYRRAIARLTRMQRYVTQEDGTEPPFRNEYNDHHEAGLYVDVVSGEALFSSTDKFDSGTGWPSFTRPVNVRNVRLVREDDGRMEVRSARADSHLGHVFDDGPAPTGQRYCMNSAALRFVPTARLQAAGYGEYLRLFQHRR